MSDIISAVSLIFVIIALTFNNQIKEINIILDEPDYEKGMNESRKHQKNKSLKILIVKAIPLFLMFFVLFLILLPKAWELISESNLSIWNFNILTTLFLFIEIIILVFVIYDISIIINLIKKIRRLG
ncbi:MAG: hypothetical protein JXA68_10335 [Ignavibacteriales bacterium]|nr:hypothetical protein [Ignavibacteriales bacterium]